MAIFERAAIGAIFGAALLFAAWFRPKTAASIPAWAFPIAGLIGWFFLGIAFAAVGARAASAAVSSLHPNEYTFRLTVGGGAIAGLYSAAITSQLIANAARALQGLPPHKIAWGRRGALRGFLSPQQRK